MVYINVYLFIDQSLKANCYPGWYVTSSI